MSGETYYKILGVESTASQAAIRKAYLKLSLKYHPDKNPESAEEAKEQFVKIGEAYEVLSDPTRRSVYDRELRFGGVSTSNSANFNSGTTSTSAANSSSSSSTYSSQGPSKSYESYRAAFDDHVANMSEDELRAAMGTAAIVGGLVGSVLGSGLGKKLAGNSKIGQAIFETAGSLIGSTVGSEAGVDLVRNVHVQSQDRIMYEERKRVAMARGEPLPEKPKDGWGDLKKSVLKSFNAFQDVRQQMQSDNNSGATNGRRYRYQRR